MLYCFPAGGYCPSGPEKKENLQLFGAADTRLNLYGVNPNDSTVKIKNGHKLPHDKRSRSTGMLSVAPSRFGKTEVEI